MKDRTLLFSVMLAEATYYKMAQVPFLNAYTQHSMSKNNSSHKPHLSDYTKNEYQVKWEILLNNLQLLIILKIRAQPNPCIIHELYDTESENESYKPAHKSTWQ
jgi:hypothetical protein